MNKPNGLFGWVDLTTTDTGAAGDFYAGLFGWVAEEYPMGPDYTYTMFRKDGALVAGMGPMPPGAPPMPPVWASYILCDDIDATVAAVPGAGGAVVMPPMDIPEQGRQAMIADPGGATVGLWQPGNHTGAELFNAPGSLTWNELQSRDLDAAVPFYAEVFGWRWEPMEGSDGYLVANIDAKEGDDKSNAGAMSMPDSVPAEVPSMWMVYFAVADCDESVARAEELGGGVVFPAMDMGPGRFAGISDPTGAVFSLGSFPTGD